jgi:hypothetical protein
LLKTDFHEAAPVSDWDESLVRGPSVKTLENENEFFSAKFPCKYTFIHFHYAPGTAPSFA